MHVLVIDNYDSFVYNLVQYLGQLGADCEVRRNDDASNAVLMLGLALITVGFITATKYH